MQFEIVYREVYEGKYIVDSETLEDAEKEFRKDIECYVYDLEMADSSITVRPV